jgi:ferredoxin
VRVLEGAENVVPAGQAELDRLRECGRDGPDVRLACQFDVRGPITVHKRGLRKTQS